jgi:DNA-binding transcriptional LysR family regulator
MLEARPVFEEQLVLVTPRAIRKVSSPIDVGRSTLIAFAQGCSYRKRIEEWLGSGNVMPERILEFSSYHAMIACVAAGTGFAVVPKSVLQGVRASKTIRQHALPNRFSHNRTYIVWNGDPSPSLQGLLSLLTSAAV